MADTIIENPILNSPFVNPAGTGGTPKKGSPTRSSEAAGRALTSSRSFHPKEGQATPVRYGMDAGSNRAPDKVNRIRERVTGG